MSVMSAPVSFKEARSMRTTSKRKVNSLMKEADVLSKSSEWSAVEEFQQLANKLRQWIDDFEAMNDHMIRLKTLELKADDFTGQDELEPAEEKIENTEQQYLNTVIDPALPVVRYVTCSSKPRKLNQRCQQQIQITLKKHAWPS